MKNPVAMERETLDEIAKNLIENKLLDKNDINKMCFILPAVVRFAIAGNI